MQNKEIEVMFTDGTTRLMPVRKIPVRSLSQLASVWSKEPLEVDCYLGQPEKFSESLHDDSFEEVMKIGRALNKDSLTKYLERRKEAILMMGVDIDKVTADLAAVELQKARDEEKAREETEKNG